MKRTTQTTLAASMIAAAGLLATDAQGQATLYEGFDYSSTGVWNSSPLNGQGAAADGWTAAWSTSGQKNGYGTVGTPGNTYGDLAVSGNNAGDIFTNGDGYWGAAFRTFGNTLLNDGLLADGGELWFSIIIDGSAVTGGGSKLGFSIGNGSFGSSDFDISGEGVGLLGYNTTSASAVGWSNSIANVDQTHSGSDIAGATPTLIVGHVQWGATAGDDETLTLYAPDTSLNQGAALQVNTFAGVDQASFDRVALLYKDRQMYDEIRIGATYADVTPVPEPSSLALIGLGGLCTLRRRRRA